MCVSARCIVSTRLFERISFRRNETKVAFTPQEKIENETKTKIVALGKIRNPNEMKCLFVSSSRKAEDFLSHTYAVRYCQISSYMFKFTYGLQLHTA